MSITFIDGTMTTADLVISADGIHSAVRSQYVVCASHISSDKHMY